MRYYRLRADILFLADDLDDAFAKLAEHFQQLADGPDLAEVGEDGRGILCGPGEIDVRPESQPS